MRVALSCLKLKTRPVHSEVVEFVDIVVNSPCHGPGQTLLSGAEIHGGIQSIIIKYIIDIRVLLADRAPPCVSRSTLFARSGIC